jgi:hypothetical protein
LCWSSSNLVCTMIMACVSGETSVPLLDGVGEELCHWQESLRLQWQDQLLYPYWSRPRILTMTLGTYGWDNRLWEAVGLVMIGSICALWWYMGSGVSENSWWNSLNRCCFGGCFTDTVSGESIWLKYIP